MPSFSISITLVAWELLGSRFSVPLQTGTVCGGGGGSYELGGGHRRYPPKEKGDLET